MSKYQAIGTNFKFHPEDKAMLSSYVWHFIHVPKTGGTHLNNVINASNIEKDKGLKWVGLGHSAIAGQAVPRGKKQWYSQSEVKPSKVEIFSNPKYAGISVIRNPFSMLASWYRSDFGNVREDLGVNSFSDFIKSYCSKWTYDDVVKERIPGLTEEIQRAYDTSAPKWFKSMKVGKTFSQSRHQPWGENLYFQLFTGGGKLAPAMLFRQENLDSAIRTFLDIYGIDYKDSIAGVKIESNITDKPGFDYRKLYTDRTRELIENKCRFELQTFGYNFDGPIEDSSIILPDRDQISYFSNPFNYLGYFT